MSKTILIVEDNENNMMLVRDVLQMKGMQESCEFGSTLLLQQIAERMLIFPSIGMKVALIRADDASLAILLGQKHQRRVRQIHWQIGVLAHQGSKPRQMISAHDKNAHALCFQSFHPVNRFRYPDPGKHQVDAFHQNRILRHQRLAVIPEKLTAAAMVGIAAIRQGQPGARVHQNHYRLPRLAEKLS